MSRAVTKTKSVLLFQREFFSIYAEITMLRMKPKIYSLSGSQADDEREMIANTKEFKGESYGSAPDNTS